MIGFIIQGILTDNVVVFGGGDFRIRISFIEIGKHFFIGDGVITDRFNEQCCRAGIVVEIDTVFRLITIIGYVKFVREDNGNTAIGIFQFSEGVSGNAFRECDK